MFLLAYIKEILIGISTFITLYLFNRNKNLKIEKEQLKEEIQNKNKIVNIQQKILDVSEKIKPTDLDVNLERLSDKPK